MKKRLFVVLNALILVFIFSKMSFACSCGSCQKGSCHQGSDVCKEEEVSQAAIVPSALPEAVNVGNKICPVLGEKINEKMKVAYIYEGKSYNLCCFGCIDEFKKDPLKYIQKVKEELQVNSL